MTEGTLVFLERKGEWAMAWRRLKGRPTPGLDLLESKDRRLVTRETRSRDELLEVLRQSPRAFVGVELTLAHVEPTLELIAQVTSQFPRSIVVALGQRGTEQYEGLAREFGASCFVRSPLDLGSLCVPLRTHLGTLPALEMSIEEETLARLPWGPRTTRHA